MTPNIHRKNVQESLDLWAAAEKKQRTLSFDDYGDVHLVYTSVAEHAPELGLELKRLAVLNLLAKIQTELRKFAAATKQESVEHLLMQLPSLGKFAASGQIGNLRKEWQQLQAHQEKRSAQITTERLKIFNEFKQYLPQMPTHFQDDGTAILRHEFNTSEQQDLIKKQIEEANKYKLDGKGYYRTFTADLPRSRWSVEIEGKTESYELGQPEDKLAALKKVFSHDQAALSTASKIMNQVAPSFVTVPLNTLFPRDLGIFIKSGRNNEEENFYQISSKGNLIHFESNTYAKAETVLLNPDQKNQRTWQVNQGEKWKGSPGPKNYAQHYRLSIQIDKQAASQGLIKIAEGTRIEASVEFHLCPSVAGQSDS